MFTDRDPLTRRDCLRLGLGTIAGAAAATGVARDQAGLETKSVAAVVTIYSPNSHADVILTKILQGWAHDGGPGPALRLASVYIDQPDRSAFGIDLCRKHGIPVFNSIAEAVTVGGNSIPVDGVLSIGEHGSYPLNVYGQLLYPRRRFLDEILTTFEKHQRVVPVFNDKHLGPVWTDALAMYERTRTLKVPFMAGSSLPVGKRTAEISVPMGCDIDAAVGIAYGGLEVYGFHALELFQWHVERRHGAERGVKAVRFLEGPALWQAVDEGRVSTIALEAALSAVPKKGQPDIRKDPQAGLFLFEYVDGLTGAILYLSCVHGTSIGLSLKQSAQPIGTAFDELTEPRYPHFAYLLKAIEQMIYSGRSAYPVERTLLTSGILDRALRSRAEGGRRIETPELEIAYSPIDYPPAPHRDLNAPPRQAATR